MVFLEKEVAMKVKEVMRTSVAKVSPVATVGETLSMMDDSGVTSLPVEDAEGCLLGVARLAVLSRALADGSVASSAAVGDGLSSHLVTATPEMDVARVAEMMRDRGVDDIMVVEGRYLVGALSLAETGTADTGPRPAS
jgi:CBS domain-containing protein